MGKEGEDGRSSYYKLKIMNDITNKIIPSITLSVILLVKSVTSMYDFFF